MDKTQEPTKKCFCARCFLPVDAEDRVDIEGHSFHRLCSMCCVCRTIPPSLKMFYGHVFCNECFKTHVLSRFRGESPRIHSNSWWMQWAPGNKPQEAAADDNKAETKPEGQPSPEEPPKKCICARCLQCVDNSNKVEVFCEECFNKHVLNRNKDNPAEFFKQCFDQWQNNAQFADNMREFMAGNKDNNNSPFIFMMQGQQPPFCRCGSGPQEWFQNNEPKKSATPAVSIAGESFGTWDLSFENRTEVSDIPESVNANDESANVENCNVYAAEKIEKLTKYLHERRGQSEPKKCMKKWKNFNDNDKLSNGSPQEPTFCRWVDLQDSKLCRSELDCPKCLWQCGPIYVNSEYLQKFVTEIYE
ncbi:hypothetical protein HF086_014654 [Spodoptera exigua]|uniref:Uncharacterized protein n=1 Tax=Spodoptera exigua TaxID=7107 RepID=A0A922M671_SPOEX|nr:hypothetical protein HF086_014654 [Spodoptera exigua]